MTAHENRLEQVLSAYGRNPLRWPQADRVHLAHLLRRPELMPVSATALADQLDQLLDVAGANAVPEPEGARARLVQRMTGEARQVPTPSGRSNLSWWRAGVHPQGLVAAGMLAASIAIGIFIGVDTSAGTLLADSLLWQSSSDEVLDLVLLEDAHDGGLL